MKNNVYKRDKDMDEQGTLCVERVSTSCVKLLQYTSIGSAYLAFDNYCSVLRNSSTDFQSFFLKH